MSSRIEVATLEQISPRAWTRCFLCFQIGDEAGRNAIIENLGKALKHTAQDLPFLSGKISEVQDSHGRTRLQWKAGRNPKLFVKDLGGLMPSFEELRSGKFPMSAFDGDLLCATGVWYPRPCKELAVCAAQINFIEGGMLFATSLSHIMADGTTMTTFLQRLAAHCNQGATVNALPPQVFDKTPLFSHPARKASTIQDHPEFILLHEHPPSPPPSFTKRIDGQLFHFSAQSTAALKDRANPRNCSTPQSQDWVSTDAALSALIWRSVVSAACKSQGIEVKSTLSGFCSGINARGRFDPPLPRDFVGSAWVLDPATKIPLNELLRPDPNLADIAMVIQKSREKITSEYLDSLISLIDTLPDPSLLLPAAFTDALRTTGAVSSWANFPLYDSDWGGLLGKCQRVRIAQTGLMNGLQVVLPALPERLGGGLEVVIGLEDEVMKVLMHDELWMAYASAYP